MSSTPKQIRYRGAEYRKAVSQEEVDRLEEVYSRAWKAIDDAVKDTMKRVEGTDICGMLEAMADPDAVQDMMMGEDFTAVGRALAELSESFLHLDELQANYQATWMAYSEAEDELAGTTGLPVVP